MPTRRFGHLPPQRRAEILASAAAEFAKYGFHGTSYNRLLERIGLGKSSAYYYFEDKADLFMAVVVDRYTAFYEGTSTLALPRTAGEFWTYIEGLNLRGMEFMLEDPTSAALMQCVAREGTSAELITAAESVLIATTSYHRELLVLGQRLGAVRQDAPLDLLVAMSRACATASDGWFAEHVDTLRTKRKLADTARLWTELQRGMFAPSAAESVARRERGRKPDASTTSPKKPSRTRRTKETG